MSKIIKMKDLLKKEGIELGKVYTDKTMPPFKVEEEKLAEGKNAKLISNLKSDLSKLDKLVKSKKPTDSFLKKDMIVLTKAANKIFDRIGTFKYFTEEKLSEMKVNKGKVDKTYKSVLNHMRKVIKKLNDDEMYEVTTQLKKWFNKNIY